MRPYRSRSMCPKKRRAMRQRSEAKKRKVPRLMSWDFRMMPNDYEALEALAERTGHIACYLIKDIIQLISSDTAPRKVIRSYLKGYESLVLKRKSDMKNVRVRLTGPVRESVRRFAKTMDLTPQELLPRYLSLYAKSQQFRFALKSASKPLIKIEKPISSRAQENVKELMKRLGHG